MAPLDFRNKIHQVDTAHISRSPEEFVGKQRTMAFFIGVLAMGLAFGVVLLDKLFGTFCARDSISHYYYAPIAGTGFVIALAMVAAFLFTYEGENKFDWHLANVAAVMALIVAFVPTYEVGCSSGQSFDVRPFLTANNIGSEINFTKGPKVFGTELASKFHLGAAALLFAILFYFSAFIFTRIREGVDRIDGVVSTPKKWRNVFYTISSLGMLVSFGIIGFSDALQEAKILSAPVFIGEGLALICFGISWLVKGRFWFGWLDEGKARPNDG